MTSARFPSQEFPDVPTVEVTVPDRWSPRAAAGSLFAVILDRGADAFSPNLVVTHARHAPDYRLDESDAAIDAYVGDLAESRRIGRRVAELAGREWRIDEFAYVDEEAGTVVQIIATTLVPSPHVSDVIRLTGSALAESALDDLPVLREIVGSALVGAR